MEVYDVWIARYDICAKMVTQYDLLPSGSNLGFSWSEVCRLRREYGDIKAVKRKQ